MTTEQQSRMQYLIDTLKPARESYEQFNVEIMPNFDYDALYSELEALEKETGVILPGSPTQLVGYEVISDLEKEAHPSPMLSQAKTKLISDLQSFIGKRKGLLSRKMDGLTIVLHYENGNLVKAVTRGNGKVGEIVTHAARAFENVPDKISYKGKLVMRGEAIITYRDFESVNELAQGKYKNPRNLCSGSVRVHDASITASRHVRWICFQVVSAEDVDFDNSVENSLQWVKSLGFDIVTYIAVNEDIVAQAVADFEEDVKTNQIPSDGLILMYDDIAYGESLGSTGHNPRNSIAFKWKDEVVETKLLDILWSVSKTGQINPIALFEPVELEGTTVQRASLHNVSIVKGFQFGIGDRITVFKANMIIPQVAENLTKSDTYKIPDACPVCGHKTHLSVDPDSSVEILFCGNPECVAKQVTRLSHFTTRNAMNIMGLSDNQIEDLINIHVLSTFGDFYRLKDHESEIVNLEGWGQKSYDNMIQSIEKSRDVELSAFLYALSIPMIGSSTAKLIAKHFGNDYHRVAAASYEELIQIEGVGDAIATKFVQWFADEDNKVMLDDVLSYVHFTDNAVSDGGDVLNGMTIVITGSLGHFDNRDALVKLIESHGGKVSSSVSSKTSLLVNNDVASTSGKNKKAKDLGVEIVSEDEFLSRFGLEA